MNNFKLQHKSNIQKEKNTMRTIPKLKLARKLKQNGPRRASCRNNLQHKSNSLTMKKTATRTIPNSKPKPARKLKHNGPWRRTRCRTNLRNKNNSQTMKKKKMMMTTQPNPKPKLAH